MRFSIDVGSELELKLHQAVLLYKNDHGNRHMATVHSVVQQNGDGSPLLGAGQLLSTASLRELARQHSGVLILTGSLCGEAKPGWRTKSPPQKVDTIRPVPSPRFFEQLDQRPHQASNVRWRDGLFVDEDYAAMLSPFFYPG